VSAGTFVATADVSVTKTLNSQTPSPAQPGDVVTWDITVSNAGPNAASNVVWSDTLPPGTTFDEVDPPGGIICVAPLPGATGTVTCSIPSLAASSSSGPYHLQTIVGNGATGTIDNTVTVTADTADPDATNNEDTASVDVTPVAVPVVPTLSGAALGVLGGALAFAALALLRR
jgi:uncharacterized repeat protein (TIGR01451 family)